VNRDRFIVRLLNQGTDQPLNADISGEHVII